MATIVLNFSNVIGTRVQDTNTIIDWLSEESQLQSNREMQGPEPVYRFTDLVNKLIEGVDIAMEYNYVQQLPTAVIKKGTSKINTVKEFLGQGSFGSAYLTHGGFVYKQITLRSPDKIELETQLRSIYLEIFIQTVASSDPTVGKYVCKPVRLYRSATNYGPGIMALYIQMEPIKYKFPNYMMTLIEKKQILDIDDILPILEQLGLTLSVLQKRYGFYHGDTHTGNLMITDTGDIKLIDFGFSCLDYNGTVYRTVRTNESDRIDCFSFDLLLFLVNLIEAYTVKTSFFSESAKKVLRGFLTHGPGSADLYKILERKAAVNQNAFVFHQAYISKVKLDRTVFDLAATLPMLDPDNMKDLTAYLAGKNRKRMNRCIGPICAVQGGNRTRKNRRRGRKTLRRRY